MLQIAAGKGSNTRMILSITPNPALDRTLVVPKYGEGGVFRPQQQIAGAGGKGINVARAAVALGSEATALGFLAGHTGKLFAEFSEREHIKSRWTWLREGETRTCIVLLDPAARRTSVINEFGPPASAEDWHALQADALLEAKHASTICVCGSLPAGSPINAFRTLIAALRDTGKPVWADTSGAALDAALMPGVNIKISHDEAAELLGTPIETAEETAQATEELSRRIGGAKAIITMSARGAAGRDDTGAWQVSAAKTDVVSTLGCGDSFLAGLLVAFERGDNMADALKQASAAGTANALSIGGGRFTYDDFLRITDQTHVEPI